MINLHFSGVEPQIINGVHLLAKVGCMIIKHGLQNILLTMSVI